MYLEWVSSNGGYRSRYTFSENGSPFSVSRVQLLKSAASSFKHVPLISYKNTTGDATMPKIG